MIAHARIRRFSCFGMSPTSRVLVRNERGGHPQVGLPSQLPANASLVTNADPLALPILGSFRFPFSGFYPTNGLSGVCQAQPTRGFLNPTQSDLISPCSAPVMTPLQSVMAFRRGGTTRTLDCRPLLRLCFSFSEISEM